MKSYALAAIALLAASAAQAGNVAAPVLMSGPTTLTVPAGIYGTGSSSEGGSSSSSSSGGSDSTGGGASDQNGDLNGSKKKTP